MPLDQPQPRIGDAFGAALLAYQESRTRGGGWATEREAGWHVVERDDGYTDPLPVSPYFAEPPDWRWDLERLVLDRASGRVLDIGAGAGRFCLALGGRGLETVGLDPSAGAIDVCRARGLSALHQGTVFDLAPDEPFDTFLLMGNNIGLLESADHAPRFLAALHRLAAPGARVLGIGLDPTMTEDEEHLAYQERNRARGRLPGQLRLRIRFGRLATDWWDYLLVPPTDLGRLVGGGGWELTGVEREHALYLATLTAS